VWVWCGAVRGKRVAGECVRARAKRACGKGRRAGVNRVREGGSAQQRSGVGCMVVLAVVVAWGGGARWQRCGMRAR